MGRASRKKQKSIKKTDAGVSVESSPFGGYATAVAFILIAVTALLIYSNTFHGPFLFDDEDYIFNNPKILNLENFFDISGTRYVTFLSFAINYALGGYNTFGYHLVNTIIHIINGLLVWWLVILTFRTPAMERVTGDSQLKYFIALAAALIFISHPVQTQAVTYITQRFASLATLFYLLSLALFVKWRLSSATLKPKLRTVIYAASVLSAVLAMKTKEISFTLPFIILLYDFAFFNDKPLKERLLSFTPFALTLAIIPLSLFSPELGVGESEVGITEITRSTQIKDLMTISRHDYLITQFRVIATYLRLLVLPVNQNIDYDYPLYNSLFDFEVFLSFIALVSIFGLAVYLFIRSRKTNNGYGLLASFGVLWFFITLSVESSVIPIKDVIFEHRLYLPSVGAVIAFTAFIFYAKERLGFKISAMVFTCALLLITAFPLSLAAYNRNLLWKDAVIIWEDVIAKSPEKARAYNNLGVAYKKAGWIDKAFQAYEKALSIKPDDPETHYNLGNTYADMGQTDVAIVEYKEAVRLLPTHARAYYNLGNAFYKQGRIDEAIQEYKKAVKFKPNHVKAHNNLGIAFYKQGRIDEAIQEYRKAVKLAPDFAEAHYNLGLAYKRKGLKNEAIREFERVLKITPGDATARNILESLTER